jgi:2-polyprenyl-6-methoxyphenol hydroxylase-like FAD-dependent oxidoreductase
MKTVNRALYKRAVVIGSGIGGIAAAGVLSGFCEEVFLLERDSLPGDPVPRPGVPQGKHPHGLLAGGLKALEGILPGIDNEQIQRGAVPIDFGSEVLEEVPGLEPFQRRALGWNAYALSRPSLESCLLDLLQQRTNVELRAHSQVIEITGTPHGAAVTGVRYKDSTGRSEALSADVVVDASGHGSFTIDFLKGNGCSLPEVSRVGIDIHYSSTVFAGKDIAEGIKIIASLPNAPERSKSGFLLNVETNRWQVTMAGRHDTVPPVEEQEFLAYAQQLEQPTIYNAIKKAKRVEEIYQFRFPESRWRHFSRLGDFPCGLFPIGDAICRFNPIWGQGMSVAAREAELLQSMLDNEASNQSAISTLSQRFLAQAESTIADPWAMSTIQDLVYPETRGERPPDFESRLEFQRALRRMAVHDHKLRELMIEVRHLLKPASVLRAPEIVSKVEGQLAQV